MIKEIVESLPSLLDSLKKESSVFLYGMGNGAEKIYSYLSENGIEIRGVVASDGFLRGQSFLGFDVSSVSEVEKAFENCCFVICFGLEGEKSRFLKDFAKERKIYSPNLPVFGIGACDKKFILENIEKFERVYEILEDDKSREIYLSLIKYNVTGDISYLEVENSESHPEDFYNHNKRHIDIGAYDGDTVLSFIKENKAYSDIIAFEPDRTTYKKLLKNTKEIRNVIAENSAVCDKNGEIAFDSGNGRASHCGEGEGKIRCVSVDNYCGFTHIHADGAPVGSIKIDAEGMDEAVICGAVNTIYCCRCAISVALYHRAEDIIELPLLLRKHNPRYKFYLRKKEYIPAWDVFLYVKED